MPFLKEIVYKDTLISLWEIQENETLQPYLASTSLNRVHKMKHPNGFLAIRKLLEHYNYSDTDLTYDCNGKPFLRNGKHISISHSGKYAAVAIGFSEVGIDIEKISPKLIKAAPYFLKEKINFLSIETLTVFWCVKEAIYKISNSKPLSFKEHLEIKNYSHGSCKGIAQSTLPEWENEFDFQVYTLADYILVACSKR